MRKILNGAILAISILMLSGCANINPRLDEKIDNQNGKIDEIKNNQNGVMTEIGKIKQDQALNNSQLKDVQNGYANLKNQMFNKDNSGVQILQGDGPLFMIFASGVVFMVMWHYRSMAKRNEKAANIMAQQIAMSENEELKDKVLRSAMHTDVEKDVYHMINKHKV
jgi:hypothetical protein